MLITSRLSRAAATTKRVVTALADRAPRSEPGEVTNMLTPKIDSLKTSLDAAGFGIASKVAISNTYFCQICILRLGYFLLLYKWSD
jgi:hypothetical protein